MMKFLPLIFLVFGCMDHVSDPVVPLRDPYAFNTKKTLVVIVDNVRLEIPLHSITFPVAIVVNERDTLIVTSGISP